MALVCWFFFFKSHNFPEWDVNLSKKFSCATFKQLFSFLQSTKKRTTQSNKSNTATNCSSKLHKFSPIKTCLTYVKTSLVKVFFFFNIFSKEDCLRADCHICHRDWWKLVQQTCIFCTEIKRELKKARQETNSLAGKFLDFRHTPWRTCCRISCLQECWVPRYDKYFLLQVISQLQAIEKLASKPVDKNQAPSMEQKVSNCLMTIMRWLHLARRCIPDVLENSI